MRNIYTSLALPLCLCASFGHQCLFSFRPLLLAFCLCAGFALQAQTATDPDPTKVDNDGDGLIEIWTLTDLNNMRYNLAGTGLRTTELGEGETVVSHPGDATGCPDKDYYDDAGTPEETTDDVVTSQQPTCHGYELMNDLDFRIGCGNEGTAASACTHPAWVPVNDASPTAQGAMIVAPDSGLNPGWTPIGDTRGATQNYPYAYPNAFTSTFDGNNHTISNLYVNLKSALESEETESEETESEEEDRRTFTDAGLFGYVTSSGLKNLGLTGNHMSVTSPGYAGGLVGQAVDNNRITNCHATGNVSGGTAGGGLAGYIRYSPITSCYATGDVSGGPAGGLVGSVYNTTIRNSYVTGNVSSPGLAGGLVGNTSTGFKIANCYATGDVSGANGGLLVGGNSYTSGRITNCYATGNASFNSPSDWVGRDSGSSVITACYYSGVLKVGSSFGVIVVQPTSQYRTPTQLKALVAGELDPADLTKSGWDAKDWDFGDNAKLPRLRSYKEDANENQVQGEVLSGQDDLEERVREPVGGSDDDDDGDDDDNNGDGDGGDDDGDDGDDGDDDGDGENDGDDDTALLERVAALEKKVSALESQNVNTITFTKRDLNEPDIVSGTTKKSIVIVPNPVQQTLALTVYQDYDYAIYDSAGGAVKTGKTSEGSIDVSELRAGTYVLQLKSVTETYALQFIKE